MANLNAFSYTLTCTNRAKKYFPSSSREGFLIKIDDHGGYGFGEYAPLKGIHHIGLQDALRVLQEHHLSIMAGFFDNRDDDYQNLALFFDRFPYPMSYFLSMAFFHHAMQKKAAAISERSVKLTGLIEANTCSDAVMHAQHYLAQGYSCLKIKVGHLELKEEINKIKSIAAIASRQVSLRLDANRSLSVDDAKLLLKGLGRVKIEYFEEPLQDAKLSKILVDECGINVAFDESITSGSDLDALKNLGATHVIIKPGRFSSIYAVMLLAKKAQEYSIKPILSHCFESEFSASIYALMIDELGLHDAAHGIFADGFFKEGIAKNPLRSLRGKILIQDAYRVGKEDFLHSSNLKPVFSTAH
jgi:O-succinylbenzoate synthase